MKKLILPTAIFLFSASARAEYVNDFHCYLHEGYTVPSLFEFQQEWMQAAKEKGFDETYRTRVLFPVYNAETSTDPVYFIWRGFFKDGAQWGRMSDWFLASPWAALSGLHLSSSHLVNINPDVAFSINFLMKQRLSMFVLRLVL